MIYMTKTDKHKLRKMAKKVDPYRAIDKALKPYSSGGDVQRSFYKNIGDIVNKDYGRKFQIYSAVDKIMKKIDDQFMFKNHV